LMTIATELKSPQPAPPSGRVRLEYTDGMRGIGACLVASHHLYLRILDSAGPRSALAAWPKFTVAGHSVVAMFIVLSGYSLMISVARSPDHRMKGGFWQFVRRRARRIIPPYYAGLLFSIAPLLPRWIGWPHLPWKAAGPVDLSVPSLFAHLLLVHNFRGIWVRQINSAYWSIATEWQMYFAFPLLLLPIWRRFGSVTTIGFGLVVGIIIGRISGMQMGACPWYLGLFAMGMAGSAISFGSTQRSLGPIGWAWIAMAFLAGLTIVGWAIPLFFPTVPIYFPLTDSLTGLGTMALMIACTDRCKTALADQTGGVVALLTLLEWRPVALIGVMSYSLYLIHGPLINLSAMLLAWLCGPTASARLWLLPFVSIPVIWTAVWIFHQLFERPFMTERQTKIEDRR
jgi:peptidoglycan/LPS O-acetylase OafA/YrhL